MNTEDLNKIDPNTKFKKIAISADLQDKVMKVFNFSHPAEAMECGLMVLSSFAEAKEQGCDMMYFYRQNKDNLPEYLSFDYIKLIEFIKTRPNETCTHGVKLNIKETLAKL